MPTGSQSMLIAVELEDCFQSSFMIYGGKDDLDNGRVLKTNPFCEICNEGICWLGSPWFWSAMWLLSLLLIFFWNFQFLLSKLVCFCHFIAASQAPYWFGLIPYFANLKVSAGYIWLKNGNNFFVLGFILIIWLTFGYIWAFLGAGVCSAPERVGLVPTVTHVKVSQCMQPKNIVNAHNATLDYC